MKKKLYLKEDIEIPLHFGATLIIPKTTPGILQNIIISKFSTDKTFKVNFPIAKTYITIFCDPCYFKNVPKNMQNR